MQIKYIQEEDIINYKKCSMFIAMPYCSFKCEKECGIRCCQNSSLTLSPIIDVPIDKIWLSYHKNFFTSAIVLGGLEPFDSWDDILSFVEYFRQYTLDDIVIYTGYKEDEIHEFIKILSRYPNIIIKYGRFIPNSESHFDEILGVQLASPNQYGKKIS